MFFSDAASNDSSFIAGLQNTVSVKYEDILGATDNFAPDRILGRGGYGIIFYSSCHVIIENWQLETFIFQYFIQKIYSLNIFKTKNNFLKTRKSITCIKFIFGFVYLSTINFKCALMFGQTKSNKIVTICQERSSDWKLNSDYASIRKCLIENCSELIFKRFCYFPRLHFHSIMR